MNNESNIINITNTFILDNQGVPIREPDLKKWALWIAANNMRVKLTRIGFIKNPIKVCTVFTATNLSNDFSNPMLWETVVFGGKLDQEVDRCGGSREQAKAMHKAMCKRVRATK